MPVSPRREQITPFADEAMRLLRETWANPTMLAEEMFAILQRGIPLQRTGPINVNLSYGSTGSGITITQNGDGPFMTLVDDAGQVVATIGSDGTYNGPVTNTPQGEGVVSPTTFRIRPTIIWEDPDDITEGEALSGTQLNATAIDPNSNMPVSGTFVYTPPSGTILSAGDDQQLNVVFTPDNTVTYKRARKTVEINVIGATPLSFDSMFETSDAGSVDQSVSDGSLIIVFVATISTSSGDTVSVSDSQSNTYTQFGSYVSEDYDPGTVQHIRLSVWKAYISADAIDFVVTTSGASEAIAVVYFNPVPVTPLTSFTSNSEHEVDYTIGDPIDIVTMSPPAGDLVAVATFGIDILEFDTGILDVQLSSGGLRVGTQTSTIGGLIQGEVDSTVTDQSNVSIGVVVDGA